MMPQLSHTLLALGGPMLDQLLHIAEGAGARLAGFLLARLEFVELSPASAVTGLMANVFIVWWLLQTAERSASAILNGSAGFGPSSRPIRQP